MGVGETAAAGPAPSFYGGRRRVVPDRNCFAAIVFMARTSTPWRLLPAQELGCGSPTTCWRRLTERPMPGCSTPSPRGAGSAGRARPAGLDAGQRGHHERARQTRGTTGANPVDRGKPGASSTCLRRRRAGHWPRSPPPAWATPPCSRRSSTTSRRSARLRGGGAPGLARSTPTRGTTARPTAPICGGVGSPRESPDVDRVVDPAGTPPLAVERSLSWLSCWRRLQVRWGSRVGAVRVRAGGLCGRLFNHLESAEVPRRRRTS